VAGYNREAPGMTEVEYRYDAYCGKRYRRERLTEALTARKAGTAFDSYRSRAIASPRSPPEDHGLCTNLPV